MDHAPSVRTDASAVEAFAQAIRQQQGRITLVSACAHCWHPPRVWQGPLPAPQLCCWCGATGGPPHGPFAEG